MKLQDKIMGTPDMGWRERYQAEGTEASSCLTRPGSS